jgi:uncharacterized membrane protein
VLSGFLNWMGFGLCHQLPERSYFAGGLQAPVCVRDTGIYIGFVIALAIISAAHRGERPRGFPRAHVWATMGLALAFMGWDGVTSYAGLRETTNALRLLTGLGVGFSAAALVVPMLNDELWKVPGVGRVLDPTWRYGVWVAGIPLGFVTVGAIGPRLGIAFPLLIAMSIVATLTAINMVIVAMLPAFDRKASRVWDLWGVASVGVVLSFAEIALAGQLRTALVGLAERLAA